MNSKINDSKEKSDMEYRIMEIAQLEPQAEA